ncbi:DNA ligase D [Desertivirga brevis]|uniref:DNA ligase D n=1 Tax=Desertivirga brevis TaxID=2810310 RepID=UPI001A95F5FD|nr:DNA ligase D [Pedobacter sp. SYSU D00873]
MGLKEYKKKRNFNETAEPDSGEKSSTDALKFVVQRHHASRLHYDFRLELEGVLKSWAVPKGPSLNPKDKRLAMMVEDHPYDYRTFEGVIPEGNYGAGVVSIFDEGTYEGLDGPGEAELKKGLYSGNLKFRLHGKILKGEFALVKLKSSEENSWLLIKHKDEFAVAEKFDAEDLISEREKKRGEDRKKLAKVAKTKTRPKAETEKETSEEKLDIESFKPMLAKLEGDVFDDKNWIYEKKLDGYRIIASTGKTVRLLSRNGLDYTTKYKLISKALANIKDEAIIDGELVVEDKSGKALFQKLQNYDPNDKGTQLKFYAFDLLALNGHDIRQLDLIKRKELLAALLKKGPKSSVTFSEHVSGKGKKLFAEAVENSWEGIIAKDGSSNYESDKRSGKWLKFKVQNSQEALIIGFTKPQGSRMYFGSLVLGMIDNGELRYIGNVGTGFNEESLKSLHSKMLPLKVEDKPVRVKVKQEKSVTWIKPDMICEVTFSEWTDDNVLRHPVFKGLREDKNPTEVVPEPEGKSELSTPPSAEEKTAKVMETKTVNEKEDTFGKKVVKLTNLNKIYWPEEGITKGDLIEYYRDINDYILPYLKDRPLSLNRHPNGINGSSFFQKDLDTDQIPSWIKSQPIHSESNDKDIDYLICNDLPTLLWMANLGCIEINPWLSTFKKPEHPVFAVMDLDPNDVDDFAEVVRVALTTKEILDQMKVRSFIKTSGSRGLHIFIHVGAKYDYDIIKNFVQYLGKMILEQHPDTTSLERSPSKRKKKIYLDFLQNRRGQTIAAPYSVRPKPGATVSTPLSWDEVNENLNIKSFTIFNTLDRIKEKGDLWQDITKESTDLKAALESLNE